MRAGRAGLGVLATLLLSACATAPPAPPPVAATAPAAPPAVGPTAPLPAPSPRAPLVARHREQARGLERDGQLRRAVDEWKIALTIEPADEESRAGLRELQARIERQVAEHVEAGRAALKRGVQLEARRQFLLALALDPGNRGAFETLQNDVREVESVTHTVRAGETLAGLAQRYYGDRSRSEVIWETNQLPPNPKLVAGTRLKIPEIPGVPFIHPEARRPAPTRPPVTTPATAPSAPEPAPAPEEYREVNPLLAEAREALDRSDWAEALADIDRFLAGRPGNRDGLTVKKVALYRQGKAYLEARRYDDSYRSLTALASIESGYEDSAALLREARAKAVEQHYGRGVRLYREEKLADAIAEWRVVLEIDPQNANARRNIEQAERLLRALEERQKKR